MPERRLAREGSTPQIPRVTLFLSCVAALAFGQAECGALMIDRADTAVTGELWRWWTGHLVHATVVHLLFNLALFVPLGVVLERRLGSVRFAAVFAILAFGVACGVRALHDGWTTYAGLSGVVYGLVPLVLLRPHGRATLGLLIVATITVKSVLEYSGAGWLAGSEPLGEAFGVRYLAGSHIAGLTWGLLLVAAGRLRLSRENSEAAATA